jgi:hypothetical protein
MRFDPAIEAGFPASMTGLAVATGFDIKQQRILIAIDAERQHFLHLAGGVSLAPQGLS